MAIAFGPAIEVEKSNDTRSPPSRTAPEGQNAQSR